MSSWINKKLMTFSEKVIENVIDSFANKNASIDNIQNIQSSQLGKIISKVISSKYFFKNDDISYNATKLDFDWFGKDKKKRKKKKKKKTYIDGHILNERDKKKRNGNTEKEYEEKYSDENEVDSIDFSVEKSNLSPSCYSRRSKKRKTKAKKEMTKKKAEETAGKQKKKTENATENDSTIKYSIFSRNVLSVSSDDKESTAQIPSNGSGVAVALSDAVVDTYVPFGSTSNSSRNSGETEDSNSEEYSEGDSEEDSEETDSEYSTDYSHDWRSGQTSENDSFASSSTLEEMELPPRYNIFNTDGAENDVERQKETEQEREKEKEKKKDNANRETHTISSKLNWQVVKDERRKTGRNGNSEVSEINKETYFFRRERNLCKLNLLIKEAKLLFFNKNVNVSDISIYVTTILEDRKYVGKLKRLSSRTLPINNLSINEHICHNIRDIFTDIVINVKYKCKKNEKEDVIVGRVIIPLFLLLNTFPCKVKKIKNKLKYYTKCYLWLHIFPSNNKLFNYKFFKPVEGFDEYGMLNPMYTLGFLNVKIKIIFKENPYFLTLFSNMRKPIFYYKLPRYFEPLYCHYYSSNFYLYLKHIPLWVYKFFYVFNWKRIEIVPLNFFDYIFILLFWTFLFRLFVFSPFYQILIHLFFCVLFVSLSYKYGLTNYQRKMVYLFEPFKKSGRGKDFIYRKLQLLDQKDVCENTGTSFVGEKKNVHFYSRQKVALWDDNIDPNYYNCLNMEDKENEEKKKRENQKGKETNKGKDKDTFFGFGYCDGSKPAEILSNIMDYRNGFQGRDSMMTKEQNEKETMSIKVGDFEERVLNGDYHSTYTENNHIEAENFIAKTDLNQKVNVLNSSAEESNLDTGMDGREAKKEKSERLKGMQLKKKRTNITELAKKIQNIFDNNNINNNINHNNNNNNNNILNNNNSDNNNINNNNNNNHNNNNHNNNNNCNVSNDNVSSYRGSVNSGAEVEGVNTKRNYLKIPNKNNININRFMGLFHKKIENNPSEETDRESILSEKDRTGNEETEYIDPKRKEPYVNCNSGNEFEKEKNEGGELDTEVKRKQISGEFKASKNDSERRRRNERILHGCDERIFSAFRKNKRMKLPPFLLDYEMHNENILHVNSYNFSYLFGRNNDNKKLEKDAFRSELSNWNCVNPNGTLLSSHSQHSAHNETNGIKQKTAADMKKEKKLHPFVKSPFHNFRLFVNSVEKKDVSIFSNNVEVPNVQIILNRFITLVTFAQHFTGLFTMTYEKIKYAFNWSFDFYTTVNLLVLLFVCYSISVALYLLSFIPFIFYRVCMFFAFTYLSVKSYDLTEIGYNMNMYLKKRERRRRRRKRRKGKCVKINKFYEIRNMGRILKNCLTIWLGSQLQPRRHVYRNILYQVYLVVQKVITVMYLLCLYIGRQLGVFVLFQILKKVNIRIFTFLKKTGRSIILYILFAIFFVKNWYTRLLTLKDIDHMHIANLQAFKNLYFFIHRKIKKVEDAYKIGNKNSAFVCKGKHDIGGTAAVHRHNENLKGVDENKFASNRKNCLTFPVCENFKNLENCNFSSSEEDEMFSNKGKAENSYLSIEENEKDEKDEKEDNSLCYITDNENMNVHVDIFLHYYFKKKKYDLFNNFININRSNMCT